MTIMGFVPNPETAAAVVAWVRALTDKEEETQFVCLEVGFDGDTERALRAALENRGH